MHFDMFSPLKKQDKELQLLIGEIVEILVKLGVRINCPKALDLAESLGDDYLQLDQKIKTYDYSKEDKLEEAIFKK